MIGMFQTALKGALAHKARLLLTSIAIVLGVAFVSGSFVFTDTIQARFDALFTDVYSGVDATVRAEGPQFGADVTTEEAALPATLVDDVRSLDDVDAAEGYIRAFGQIIDANGTPVGGMGPPTYVYTWIEQSELNPFRISDGDGRAPTGAGELVVDVATAQTAGLAIGDAVEIQFATGTEPFTLVGVASFGDSNNLAGATISVIPRADAERILDMSGQVTYIDIVAAEGVSQDALVASIQPILPSGAEAVTGNQQTAEAIAGFTEGLGFLSIALLGFAAVAVFVGAFIIYNTFRIIVAQRTRELALLRALGASSRQVVGVVLTEALVVALLASAVGMLLGIGVAELIRAGMEAAGFGPPEGPLTVAPRTVVVSMAVGILVTAVSALLPALQASRVPPVAAMSQKVEHGDGRPNRLPLRVGLLAVGIAAVALGLVTDQPLATGLGAALAVVGVLLLAPLLTRPLATTLGRPLPGIVGQLARGNTTRDPHRTATTASALTVGIALVVFTAIFASSAKDSISRTVQDSFASDLTVTSSNFFMAVSPEAMDAIASVGQVDVASPIWAGPARVAGTEGTLAAVDSSTVDVVYNASASIDLADLGAGVLVEESALAQLGAVVGDAVPVELPSGAQADLVVAGTHTDAQLGTFAVDRSTWQRLGGSEDAAAVLVALAPDVALEDGQAAVETALAGFPSLTVSTTDEQVAATVAQVDSFLVLFTGLLGLALLIAILGIANTLALSIVERTRELGLLRAVGMSRGQVRWLITDEAVLTALFGAVVGSALGLALGWVIVTAFAEDGLSTFSVPLAQVGLWLAVSALAGVVAAALPARKASRLDVLRAISYE